MSKLNDCLKSAERLSASRAERDQYERTCHAIRRVLDRYRRVKATSVPSAKAVKIDPDAPRVDSTRESTMPANVRCFIWDVEMALKIAGRKSAEILLLRLTPRRRDALPWEDVARKVGITPSEARTYMRHAVAKVLHEFERKGLVRDER